MSSVSVKKVNGAAGEKNNQNRKIKIIKRYLNRKLYDTQQSCYVTLDDIYKMIRNKEELIVVDNEHKNDITATTLVQIIFEREKKVSKHAPIFTLREIIQNANGSISNYLSQLGVFPKEYIVRSPQISSSKGKLRVVDSKSQDSSNSASFEKSEALENRVVQAAVANSRSFSGKVGHSEETPDLPLPSKNFIGPQN